jgi:hypothetical protein
MQELPARDQRAMDRGVDLDHGIVDGMTTYARNRVPTISALRTHESSAGAAHPVAHGLVTDAEHARARAGLGARLGVPFPAAIR